MANYNTYREESNEWFINVIYGIMIIIPLILLFSAYSTSGGQSLKLYISSYSIMLSLFVLTFLYTYFRHLESYSAITNIIILAIFGYISGIISYIIYMFSVNGVSLIEIINKNSSYSSALLSFDIFIFAAIFSYIYSFMSSKKNTGANPMSPINIVLNVFMTASLVIAFIMMMLIKRAPFTKTDG